MNFSKNIPKEVRVQLEQDLEWLKTVEGSKASPMYKKIFSSNALSGEDIRNFIFSRIDYMEYAAAKSKDGKIICVPYSMVAGRKKGISKVAITPTYVKEMKKQTRLSRLAMLFHEARHLEDSPYIGPTHTHIKCPGHMGLVKKCEKYITFDCDDSAEGSYSVTAALFKNISKYCKTCSDKVKDEADKIVYKNLQRLVGKEERLKLINDLFGVE